MNKLFKGKKSEQNAIKNESKDSPGRFTQIFVKGGSELLVLDVRIADHTVGHVKQMIQVKTMLFDL